MPKKKCSIDNCGDDRHTGNLCAKHYGRFQRNGDPLLLQRRPSNLNDNEMLAWMKLQARAVNGRLETPCMEWQSFWGEEKYGSVHYRGKMVGAHRLAYALATGADIDGQMIRHRCDNPPCINPDHLEQGTQADNSHDAINRSRQVTGETDGNASLTNLQAREIREIYSTGKAKQREIADTYGVSRASISRIVNNKAYRE